MNFFSKWMALKRLHQKGSIGYNDGFDNMTMYWLSDVVKADSSCDGVKSSDESEDWYAKRWFRLVPWGTVAHFIVSFTAFVLSVISICRTCEFHPV